MADVVTERRLRALEEMVASLMVMNGVIYVEAERTLMRGGPNQPLPIRWDDAGHLIENGDDG